MVSPLQSIAANLRPGPNSGMMIGDILSGANQQRSNLATQELQRQSIQQQMNQRQQSMTDEKRLGSARYINALGKKLLSTPENMWPQMLQPHLPQLQQLGYTPEILQGMTREQVQSVVAQTEPLMGAPAGGPNIGTYNPRDYTVESFAKFVKSGDPGDLVREKGPSLEEKLEFEIDKEKGKLDVQTSAAEEKKFKEALGSEGAKIYTNLQKSAQQASAFLPRLRDLKKLAATVNTGTGAEIRLAAKKALGLDSSSMEELNAKLGELAQDILNQQTGTKTDFDFQNAVRQSASLGKTKEANALLIDALIDRQLDAVSFGDQAREAYERDGVKGVLDMRFTPQNKGITTPQTQADYDALPSGAVYIDPDDGKQYRKP